MPTENDLPLFDPAWDYAGIYEDVNKVSNQLLLLLNFLAQCENSTVQSDTIAQFSINVAIAKLQEIQMLLEKPKS